MKRILPILVLVSLALSAGALAADPPIGGGTTGEGYKTLPEVKLIPTMKKISDLVFTILLALAGIMIVVAGLLFVFGGGNPEQISKARDMIMYALIGIVIAFLAKGIVAFIEGYLL